MACSTGYRKNERSRKLFPNEERLHSWLSSGLARSSDPTQRLCPLLAQSGLFERARSQARPSVVGTRPWETILPANIICCYHMFEAARRKGVKRLVFASSNHALGFQKCDQKVDHRVYPKPDTRYGVSEVFGEVSKVGSALCRSPVFGLEPGRPVSADFSVPLEPPRRPECEKRPCRPPPRYPF